MSRSDAEPLADLLAKARGAVAIEALWDGDTQGWFVDLFAVMQTPAGYESLYLQGIRRGSDLRLFNGQVPPWPEALEATQIGTELAASLGVPFHFPSPDHPEEDCPHWWELASSSPCRRCSIRLLQRDNCRWPGVCYQCHLALEREAREARWSPEERSALRCAICGNPAVGETMKPARCKSCREAYRTFTCPDCGCEVTVHRDYDTGNTGNTCSSCVMVKRISALSPAERQRLRAAAALGAIQAIVETRGILKCTIGEAQEALVAISRFPKSDESS